MTTARMIESHGGLVRSFRINGKQYFFGRIQWLDKCGPATWKGSTVGGLGFRIEGGKAAGCSPRDWFLDIEGGNGSINCSSFVDAIRTINNA